MRLPLAAAALLAATLISFAPTANAQDAHEHDPTKKCTWNTKTVPKHPEGQTSIIDSGSQTRWTVLGFVAGIEKWNIVVMPAYQYGYVYAMDQASPLESNVSKSAARSAVYKVERTSDCCAPVRSVKPSILVSFDVEARVTNSPGDAQVSALTYAYGVNTGVNVTASAAASTEEDNDGFILHYEVTDKLGNDTTIEVPISYDSSDSSTDAVSKLARKPWVAAIDEEYVIDTDEDLEANSDGWGFDTGAADGRVQNHSMTFTTDLICSHCSGTDRALHTQNAKFLGVVEGEEEGEE